MFDYNDTLYNVIEEGKSTENHKIFKCNERLSGLVPRSIFILTPPPVNKSTKGNEQVTRGEEDTWIQNPTKGRLLVYYRSISIYLRVIWFQIHNYLEYIPQYIPTTRHG